MIAELGKCPYCKSEDLEYGDGEVQDCTYAYDVTCNECGKDFEEVYDMEFAGIITDEHEWVGA